MNIQMVKKQSSFCLDLMERLDKQIQGAKIGYGGIEHHSVMEADIIRMRRELNELRKLLEVEYDR